MRLRMIGSEALRSITANLSTTIAATVTVLIGMFLVGLLIAFGSWARSWSDHTKDKLVVKTFFCTESTCAKEATGKQIDQVRILLESNPKPNEEEIRKGLEGNLCRCTGYTNIVKAVQTASASIAAGTRVPVAAGGGD